MYKGSTVALEIKRFSSSKLCCCNSPQGYFPEYFLGAKSVSGWATFAKSLMCSLEIGKQRQYSFHFRFGGERFHFLKLLHLFSVCKSFPWSNDFTTTADLTLSKSTLFEAQCEAKNRSKWSKCSIYWWEWTATSSSNDPVNLHREDMITLVARTKVLPLPFKPQGARLNSTRRSESADRTARAANFMRDL